jgi:hypothetical protein
MASSTRDTVYTAARGRRFAFTIAAAFAVIALITAWRDRETIAAVTGGIAALMLGGGLIAPSRLEPIEHGWMKFAHALSRITTPIFMGIVYFVVLTPAGLIRRTFGSNPLVHRADNGSYWEPRPSREREPQRRRMERQF